MRQRHSDRLCAGVLVAAGGTLLFQLRNVPQEGQLFPLYTLLLLMGCALLLGLRTFWSAKGQPTRDTVFSFFADTAPRTWLTVVTIFIGYAALAMFVSFLLATFLTGLAIPLAMTPQPSKKQIMTIAAYSASMTLSFYLFFMKLLHFNFPELL